MEKEKPHALEMGKEEAQEAQKEDEAKGRRALMQPKQEKPRKEGLNLKIIHGQVTARQTPAPLPKEFACGEMSMPRWEENPKSEPPRK